MMGCCLVREAHHMISPLHDLALSVGLRKILMGRIHCWKKGHGGTKNRSADHARCFLLLKTLVRGGEGEISSEAFSSKSPGRPCLASFRRRSQTLAIRVSW